MQKFFITLASVLVLSASACTGGIPAYTQESHEKCVTPAMVAQTAQVGGATFTSVVQYTGENYAKLLAAIEEHYNSKSPESAFDTIFVLSTPPDGFFVMFAKGQCILDYTAEPEDHWADIVNRAFGKGI